MGGKLLDVAWAIMALSPIPFVVGVIVLAADWDGEREIRRLIATRIRSAAELRGAGVGQPVALEGKVEAATPAAAEALLIYLAERSFRTYRQQRRGPIETGEGQTRVKQSTPPFTLGMDGGPVPVVNRDYAINGPSRVGPTPAGEPGGLRYVGFRPGDRVLVVGTTAAGGISARVVFGGTRAEYLHALRSRLVQTERMGGHHGIVLGLLMPVPWALGRWASRLRAGSRRGDAPPTRLTPA